MSKSKGEPLSSSERDWAERAVERGVLTRAELKQALAVRSASDPDAPLDVLLVSLGFMNEEEVEGLGQATPVLPAGGAPGGPEEVVQIYGSSTVLEPLGRGPSGPVYLALHGDSGRRVALKVIPANALNRPFLARFSANARLALGLVHPRAARVLDAGVQGDALYVASELVTGPTLLESVRSEGPLPAVRAADVLAQAAGALEAAHAIGLPHGNLKPENVFLPGKVDVKVTDFGLGRGDPEFLKEHADQAGSIVFSLAPEQWIRGTVPASDFYALGVLWHLMLTGKYPFEHRWTREIRKMHEQADPPAPSSLARGVPRAADPLAARLLEKAPARRLSSVPELLRALAAVQSPRPPLRRSARRRG